MRKEEIKIYKFEELSDNAKEKAREWWRKATAQDNYFDEFVLDYAAKIAEMFGIELATDSVPLMNGTTRKKPRIYYSGFCSQGDGACFEGTWRRSDLKADKLREYAPLDKKLHNILADLESIPNSHDVRAIINRPYRTFYSHSGSMFTETEWDGCDDDVDGPFTPLPDMNELIKETMRDFANWIYRQLETEYEYQNSDEVVDENIACNEYEFYEDGSKY